MRIVIDARNSYGSGIQRYSSQLVEHLQELDHETEYVVLLDRRTFVRWRPKAPNFRSRLADFDIYSGGEQAGLLANITRLAPDLVHFTSFNAPVLYRGRRVTTVHDLTYLDFPSVRDRSSLARLKYRSKELAMRAVLRRSLQGSAAVITDTAYVRQQLLDRYGNGGGTGVVTPDRVYAIHCGVGHRPVLPPGAAAHALPRGVQTPYVLYVGNAHPHKNLGALLDGLQVTRRRIPEVKLVIAGPQDAHYRAVAEYARGRPGVLFLGYVSDSTLTALYADASAFVLPSLSEGFGLTALEAMAHGAPVLASRASCLPEVCAQAAEYFEPTDPVDLGERMAALVGSRERQDELRRAGARRVADFSWRRTAQETLDVYRRVLGAKT